MDLALINFQRFWGARIDVEPARCVMRFSRAEYWRHYLIFWKWSYNYFQQVSNSPKRLNDDITATNTMEALQPQRNLTEISPDNGVHEFITRF